MNYLISIAVCAAHLACANNTPLGDEGTATAPYYYYSFEERSLQGWEGQFSAGNFAFSTNDPVVGQYCGEFHLGANGDYWTSPNSGFQSARSEIQLPGSTTLHEEVYYSWHLKIDSSYVEDDDWQVVGQFHDQPDYLQGESWTSYPAHSPPLSYKYRNGSIIVAVYNWEVEKNVDIATTPLAKGVWHQIVTKAYWSTGTTGSIECWIDGKPLAGSSGQTRYVGRNCFNGSGNYLKIGLYRSRTIMSEAKVYYDEIKSGTSWDAVN